MAALNFEPAIDLLQKAQTIAVCGHINPDGDSIGSTLALAHALQKCGKKVDALVPKLGNLEQYDFLTGFASLKAAKDYEEKVDLFVLVDVAVSSRIGDAYHSFAQAQKTLIIDHHEHCDVQADCKISDSDAAATGILIWDLIKAFSIELDPEIAQCCLTAVVTDTGRFQYQNADARTFNAATEMVKAGANPSNIATNVYQRKTRAALELEALAIQHSEIVCNGQAVLSWVTQEDFKRLRARKQDAESLIDVIRQLKDIEIAVMLREQDNAVRGSIRTKSDRDVAAIAAQFGGGGHRAAAGFTIEDTLESAQEQVLKALQKEFA